MISTLIFATNNDNKIWEVSKMMPNYFKLLCLNDFGISQDLEETGDTLIENALQKARFIHRLTNQNCFADDTGLEVFALNNEPGVFSSRYAGEERDSQKNIELLLSNLKSVSDRRARFKTVIALIFDDKEFLFEGVVNGSITENPTGTLGFGYDPIFKPEGFEKTFAQLDLEDKNRISHRGLAFSQLIMFLNSPT